MQTLCPRATEAEAFNASDLRTTPHLPSNRPPPPEQLRLGPWFVEIAKPEGVSRHVLKRGERLALGGREGALVVGERATGPLRAQLSAEEQGLVVRDLGDTGAIRIFGISCSQATVVEQRCSFVLGGVAVSVLFGGAPAVDGNDSISGIVGTTPAMRRLCREIRRFAPLRAPVLLQGESGTGKEVVASALHALSGRTGPFIALNVGGMNENVADTELFGHRKGAFTGAVHSRPGVFEAANGGTLFLDEIADLHPSIQVKLLRVMEDQQVRPLGTHETIRVNTRVVCASWAELQERVDAGRFRADLFHRVAMVRISLPPLRSRKADLPALCEHLLGRHAAELGPKQLTPSALERLTRHDWKGSNVRELAGVLYRAAAEVEGGTFIDSKEIESALPTAPRKKTQGLACGDLRRLLEANGGNVSAAARAARVPRSTFRTLLKRESNPPPPASAEANGPLTLGSRVESPSEALEAASSRRHAAA